MNSTKIQTALVADAKKACDHINELLDFWGCDVKFKVCEDPVIPVIVIDYIP